MPTVSNHDVLGPMPWGVVGNVRHFGGRDRDRSDARDGINSLLFGEASGGPCAPPAPEHAYAHTSAAGAAGSFVSQNGYYGYHHPHPASAGAVGEGQDCSMDTSENNLPDHAFGQHPSGAASGFGAPLGPAPQHVWHAAPFNGSQRQAQMQQTRKRIWHGPAGAELGPPAAAGDDADLLELQRAAKRTRPNPFEEEYAALWCLAALQALPNNLTPQHKCMTCQSNICQDQLLNWWMP
ncbi:hypothetical protein ONE63_008600 [Megalurothrips usitatus]|uniref:Uncharacterized protein n=1 Tax=Megalurothrips usitatus TaxID=439358 RepID=A0AAV7XP56_9NEOP|nr:hypothetical protein ONE63_008600 [Megalurothrips usitatus]